MNNKPIEQSSNLVSIEMIKLIHSRLNSLESKLNPKSSVPQGEYLTPKEVCELLKISKGKFYSWVESGYLHPIKPDPNGRKTYVLRSEIASMFPNDFSTK